VRMSVAAVLAYCSYALCRTPLLPLYAQSLGAGPSLIGLVVAASTLTGVAVKLPAGTLSDVVGRRPLLLAGALVFALMPFSYLAVSTVGGLLLARLVHGHATAVFGPVASAAVSDLAPRERRGAWLGAYATAQGTGQAVAPVLAGYLLAANGFDIVFVVAGLIGLAVPVVVAGVPKDDQSRSTRVGWSAFRDGIAEVVRHRLLLVTSLAQAAQFVLNGALVGFLPLYAVDVGRLSTGQVGWLFAAQTVTTLATRPLVGRWSDGAGRRGVIITGLIVCSGTVALLPLMTTGWSLAMCLVIYAMGVATTSAATSAFVTDVSHRARYGAAHGVFGTIYDIGDALGPIAAGLVVASAGYATMFRLAAAVGGVAALGFAVSSREARTV
jgi:DHA1 family multidrug resistance protein-like MFS transporter